MRPQKLWNCIIKQKQGCVLGVGICLYTQLVQTKNKQCKSAITLQCYHPHLSDFCWQPYNHTLSWCFQNLSSLLMKVSVICAGITISGKLFHTHCLRKGNHLMFDNNLGKCGPIFLIFSPTHLWENSICIRTKTSTSPAICCYTTLWKSKIRKCYWFWQHPQQTVDMFLRTLDLTINSS